jgi:hypothetical protein
LASDRERLATSPPHLAHPRPLEGLSRRLSRAHRVVGVLFLLSLSLVVPYVRGDGVLYYAWLRSPMIDGDLHFLNEFRHGDPAFRAYYLTEDGSLKPEFWTETGHVRNQSSVGESVLWAPFFLLAHGIVLSGAVLGADWRADGYALPYLWFTGLGTALYVAVGLLLSFRVARSLADPAPALLGTVAIWGASSLLVYQYFLPIKAAPMAVFPAALLLFLWSRPHWGLQRWAVLGVVSGLLVTVHPVAVAWMALPGLSLLGLDSGSLKDRLRASAIFVPGALVGALPQLIGKAIVLGNPLDTGYENVSLMFLSPDLACHLVGACRGILLWNPITAVALAGLVVVLRRNHRLGIGLISVFLLMLYLVAIKVTPQISSFGNRFFVMFTPGFVVGLAALAQVLWERWRVTAVAVVAVSILWNGMLAFQWAWGMLPKHGAVDWSEVIQDQFTEAPRQLVRVGSLFITDREKLVRIMQRRDLERLGLE